MGKQIKNTVNTSAELQVEVLRKGLEFGIIKFQPAAEKALSDWVGGKLPAVVGGHSADDLAKSIHIFMELYFSQHTSRTQMVRLLDLFREERLLEGKQKTTRKGSRNKRKLDDGSDSAGRATGT